MWLWIGHNIKSTSMPPLFFVSRLPGMKKLENCTTIINVATSFDVTPWQVVQWYRQMESLLNIIVKALRFFLLSCYLSNIWVYDYIFLSGDNNASQDPLNPLRQLTIVQAQITRNDLLKHSGIKSIPVTSHDVDEQGVDRGHKRGTADTKQTIELVVEKVLPYLTVVNGQKTMLNED